MPKTQMSMTQMSMTQISTTHPPTAANPPTGIPRLHGDRVALRGFREDDLDDFYVVHSDPAVMRYWSFPAWTDISQATEYFASARSGCDPERLLCWATTLSNTDQVIGGVTLFAINHAQGRAEIGYALGSAHWSHGYAQEALSLALDFAFDTLGLRRIEADIDPRNTSSCKLAERLGFAREGLLRERWKIADEICDTAMYGLLAKDWHTHKSPSP